MQSKIKLFEDKKIRVVWEQDKQDWYFSIVDVVSVLNDTDYQTARLYWRVLKHRLSKEGFESVTKCNQLKMQSSDGKFYSTDVGNAETILRIIQSIPSQKAEPLKKWLAEVGAQRIDQMIDPEQTFQMAVSTKSKRI